MAEGNIFISYRRDDVPGHAGRIFDRLERRFPNRVFMDVNRIDLGEDFVEEIERQVGTSRVFIEIIGTEWATIVDHAGRRRLDQPDDFVRLEIAAALRQKITVIPILVRGVKMPDASTLPEDIAPLTRRNALEITESDFNHDVERLITRLETIFERPLDGGTIYPTLHPAPKPWERWRLALLIALGVTSLLVTSGLGWFVLLPNLRFKTNTANRANVNSVANKGNSPPVNARSATPEKDSFVAPANTVRFVNSIRGLEGKLAEHYVDFSFYYPSSWTVDPTAGKAGATNFAKVERVLRADLTQENFAVGWYASSGSPSSEFPHLVATLSSQFEKSFPEYKKLSEGPTQVNSIDGYEFRFEGMSRNTRQGDIKIWGRTIFLPPQDGGSNGVTLVMMATSLAPEIHSENDVGLKGETALILKSFRFGTPRS
jgi:TIR domain